MFKEDISHPIRFVVVKVWIDALAKLKHLVPKVSVGVQHMQRRGAHHAPYVLVHRFVCPLLLYETSISCAHES